MTPKEKLKEIYDEYLKDNKTYHFWGWLNNVYYKDIIENVTILITGECGFQTTSECRKAIKELESTTITLPITQEKRQYDILSDSKTEITEEEIDKAWNDAATQIGGYKEETWQDILNEFAQFGKGKLGDWLIENFKTPERL